MFYMHLRYPGGKRKAVTFSYDDGVPQDIRLADLFTKYGLKATFNFNSASCRAKIFSKEEVEERFISKGHEIAVHGMLHRANGMLRPIEGIRDVLDCRMELEERYDRIIRGMAYPSSGVARMGIHLTYEQVKQYLMELDIAYAITLRGDNNMFFLPQDFHNWMPSAHHNNPKIMEYVDEFLALDLSDSQPYPRREARLLYIWGHSFEFDKHNNWEHMEAICEKLAGNDEIWYANNIEICKYVQAYKQLEISATQRIVHNPTATTVWFESDNKQYCVKPGQTIRMEP